MYILVGNNTLWGFNIGEHLVHHGEKVLHFFCAFQQKRTYFKEYYGEDKSKYPPWSVQCNSIEALKQNIQESISKCKSSLDQVTVVATGFQQVLILHELNVPFYWWTDGGDIADQPFNLDPLSQKLRYVIQSSVYLKAIISSQRDAFIAARILGRSNILIRIGLPPPLHLRGFHSQDVDPSIDRMTILSAARRVYSGSKTFFSKGTEHIVDSLKLFNEHNLPLNLILTVSGPDEESFLRDIESISWKESPDIQLKLVSKFKHEKLL